MVQMKTIPWPHWRELSDWSADAGTVLASEAADIQALHTQGEMQGRCGLCGRQAQFRAGPASESIREHMHCGACGVNARQRAVAMLLLDALANPARAQVYTTENASSFYVSFRNRVGCLRGSEYGIGWPRRLQMSSWLWRCHIYELVHVEDVTRLSFGNASMDGIVCQDVLEHVSDYTAALRELARVLKPGGVLALTVPWYHDAQQSVRVARLDEHGNIECEGEPEYHGDPAHGGALCFHHFGWDLLGAMREAGFTDAAAYRVQDADAGLPEGQWVLRAIR
jgi:SAM-dependent methyltransferase